MTISEFNLAMLPELVAVLDETGQAGHCILTARVLDCLYTAIGQNAYPLRVDFEVANPAAVHYLNAGGSPETLTGDAIIARTGSGKSGMYDHHVVTVITLESHLVIVDPAIIRLSWTVPGVDMNVVTLNMPDPLPENFVIEINGAQLTYFFQPGETDFMSNEQWADCSPAAEKAREVLTRIGYDEAAESIPSC